MKEILFRHKEAGIIISLESIKKSEPNLCFNINRSRNCPVPYESDVNKKPFFDYDKYIVREIPYSDDFEAMVLDEEFSKQELGILLESLKSNPYAYPNSESLLNKIHEKIKVIMLGESQLYFRR